MNCGDRFPQWTMTCVSRKLLSIRFSRRSKAVVDAELYGRDGLFDVDPWHHFGNAKDGPGECHVASAEVVEIVLDFCGPILPKSPFDATADRPACSGLAGQDVFGKDWYVCRILVASPGGAAFCVEHPAVPGPAKTPSHASNPVCSRVGGSGNAEDRSGRIAPDVGRLTVAFDSDYPIGCELIIATNLAAPNNAARITGEGNPRGETWSRGGCGPPTPPPVASDVAARPRESWRHCGGRCLVNRLAAQIGRLG